MSLDVDYIAGAQALDDIGEVLSNTPHGEREEIADKIIAFAESLGVVYEKAEPVPLDTELMDVLKEVIGATDAKLPL